MTTMAGNVLDRNMYMDGEYLEKNPDWFVDESPFKVRQIARMIEKNQLNPKTICEVGCGAGEVLRLLQEKMGVTCSFRGYDISPQALDMCRSRANERLEFKLADITQESGVFLI